MKKKNLVVILFCLFLTHNGLSQYLANPSFEGIPQHDFPPPPWNICNMNSTPDTQPESVFLPASHGNTYLGMTVRGPYAWAPNTWEDVQAPFITHLSVDSCYKFEIDLAYEDEVLYMSMLPAIVKVYGTDVNCDKKDLLWESPAISNEDWLTYEFTIHPEEYDYEYLILEAYYSSLPEYDGYVLLDNIRIETTPKFDLGNDTTLTICEGDSLVLDPGSGFVSYLWQDGSTEPTFLVDTTGLYWVQAFNEEGCSWTDSIFITIEEYIDLESEMLDSTFVCEGQEVTIIAEILNGSPPYSFEWLGLPDTTAEVTVNADSTMFYYVIVTDQCGLSIMDSIKLVVIENPDINLGNDTLICPDGTFELHAGAGYYQYLWQDGSGDSVLIVTQPGIYWVEVTSIFGCSVRDSIIIDLFPEIPLDLGIDTILCTGESLTLTAGGGFSSYLWQDNSTDSMITVNTSGVYWVTVTDLNGCFATDSIDVSFLPLPEIDLGEDFTMCSGEEQNITPGPGYVSYLWQDGDTSQYYPVTQTGLYWVTVYNGCGEDTDSVYVEVYPQPEPDLGPDTTICNGESMLLNPGNQYVSYLWQDNSTLPFYTVTSAGTYTVTVENNYGCFGEDEVYINVSTTQVDLGGDNQICEGETVVLDAGEGFVNYLWQDNTTEQTYTVSIPGTYSVTVEDEYGCTTSDEVIYSYYPYPNPGLGPDQTICEGDTTLLQAPEGDYVYYWNGIEGEQSYEVTSTGQYTLTLVNPCDSVSDEIEVTVDPLPEVYLGKDDVLFPGQTIELDAGLGFDEYLWQDGSGDQYFMVTENNIDPANPYYHVEVTEGICKSSDTILIELYEIWVPKVITPNGDGDNDMFRADPESWSGVNQHTMIVFNRWGEKVWESTDFETGWDGKQNGRYVAEGTYFWVLEVFYGSNNIKQILKGSLTVLGSGN
jgi:gliding motility-associated-like protein